MTFIGGLLGVFFSVSAIASVCLEMKTEQIRLALLGENLANVRTTRTPEGGPFRPYIIMSCANGACDAQRDGRAFVMKYLPGHPDADANGYVAFPNINQLGDQAAFRMTALKLKLLAVQEACGAKLMIDNGSSSFAIRYQEASAGVKEDVFNLNNRQQVVSWMRVDFKGVANTLNFENSETAHKSTLKNAILRPSTF